MSVMDIAPYYNDSAFFALQRNIVVSVRDTASTGTHNRYGITQPREHHSTAPCWPLMHS